MILKKIILLLALFYISATLFFNLPKNYLKIQNSKEESYFQFFLFQRWNFFSPPPNYNERLYYTFKSKSDTGLIVYEVFEKLYKLKSHKAPFNNKEDVLDYLLSNSANSLGEEIFEAESYKRYLLETKQISKYTDTLNIVNTNNEESQNFLTLFNYGRLLALTKIKGGKIDSVKITISHIYLPKFADRYKNDSSRKEEIYFQSKYKKIE